MLTLSPPEQAERSDLAEFIKNSIERGTGRRLRHVEVSLVDNQLIVHGDAPSYYVKQLALATLLRTAKDLGVLEVVHNIRVSRMTMPLQDFFVDG